jgi:hypothetical protein
MSALPLVLGLCGPAGAGKDTAAAYLQDAYAFVPIAFADPLLDMIGALAQHVDVGGEWLVEHALKELPMPVLGESYRTLARSLGTQWGRARDEEFWIRIAAHRAAQALANGDNVLITDVRFHNELEWLHARGGRLVAIEREGAAWRPAEHVSEAEGSGLPAWRRIFNSSSRSYLHDQLDAVVEQLRTGVTA